MKSYKIWQETTAPNYDSKKTAGSNEVLGNSIRIGKGAKNSHKFAEVETSCFEASNGDLIFRLWIDGTVVKKSILRNGTHELETLEAK